MLFFKKIFLFVFIVTISLFVFNNKEKVNAQINIADFPAILEVYVENIILDGNSFISGDTVTGSFTLFNNMSVVTSNIFYDIKLGDQYLNNGLPISFYETNSYGPISLAPGEKRKIEFSYKLPKNVSGKVGIRIKAYLQNGNPLGFGDAPINVSGENKTISVGDGFITVGDRIFGLNEGPTLVDVSSSTLNLSLNLTKDFDGSVQINPEISIYNRSEYGDKLDSIKLNTIMLDNLKQNTKIIFDLPRFNNKPGVYVGLIKLADQNGDQVSKNISFRYIIGGAIFTINSVSVDRPSLKKGDDFNLKIRCSGIPENINSTSTVESNEKLYKLVINVTSESGLLVSSYAGMVTDPGPEKVLPYVLTAENDAQYLVVSVLVKDGETIISKYNTNMPTPPRLEGIDPVTSMTSTNWKIYGVILFMISIVLIFFIIIKKTKSSIVGLFIVGIFLLLSTHSVYAWSFVSITPCADGTGDTIGCISNISPNNSPIFYGSYSPGTSISLSGTVYQAGCNNQKRWVDVSVNPISNGPWPAPFWSDEKVAWGGTDNELQSEYKGGFITPATPGSYYVYLKIDYSKDIDGSGIKPVVPQATIIIRQPYSVSVDGASGIPITVMCTGGPSSVIVNGSAVNWSVALASGGIGEPYTYSWSGTDGLSGITSTVSKIYSSIGTKTGGIRVTDSAGNTSGIVNCLNSVTVSKSLIASCSSLPTSVLVGTPVNWTSTASGGIGPYNYQWNSIDYMEYSTNTKVQAVYDNGAPELVKNGADWAGASGVTPPNNWTTVQGVNNNFSVTSGIIRLSNSTTNYVKLYQTIPVVVGQTYIVSVTAKNGNLGYGLYNFFGSTLPPLGSLTNDYGTLYEDRNNAFYTQNKTFVAKTPNLYWTYFGESTAVGQFGWMDIVSLKNISSQSLRSYSESTIKTQGAYSLKGIADITTSLNKTLTRNIGTPINLTGVDTLKFDIRASRIGSNIKMVIHNTNGTVTEITPNIIQAGVWQNITWDISGVADINKNAIDKIIITIVNASAANTFYIDNFYANFPGTSSSVSTSYTVPGTKIGTITVTDSVGEQVTINCNNSVQVSSPLSVYCSAIPSDIIVGNNLFWQSSASGGTGTYTYNWTGDVTGTSTNISKIYSDPGTKTATVTVTSGSQTASKSCSAEVKPLPVFNPTLNCTFKNQPTSPVQVNTKTTWTIEPPLGSVTWKINDDIQTGEIGTFMEKYFNTVGLKTVKATVSSSTINSYGECTATTTIVQTGGGIQEQ